MKNFYIQKYEFIYSTHFISINLYTKISYFKNQEEYLTLKVFVSHKHNVCELSKIINSNSIINKYYTVLSTVIIN